MRYPGGKGKCFHRLINLMPRHSTYIESHLGGGAVLRNKRPAEFSIGVDIDPSVIGHWRRQERDRCTFIMADATEFLASYPFAGAELVYADPPYLPLTRRRTKVYRYDYTTTQHGELLEILVSLPCLIMISGYDNSLYNRKLRQWRRETFLAKTHREIREECVWLNFDSPNCLHDSSYLGDTFRERQTIRRRHTRLLQKFAGMDPRERDHILGVLNAQYNHGCNKL